MSTVAPKPPAPPLPPVLLDSEGFIDEHIRRTRRSLKLVDFAGGVISLMIGVLAFLFAAAMLDHWAVSGGLGTYGRGALFGILAVFVAWHAWRNFIPLFRPINPAYAALTIEESTPSLKNSLLNVLLFRTRRQQMSTRVYHALTQQAAVRLSNAPIDHAIDHTALLRLGYALLAVVAVCAVYSLLSPKNLATSAVRVLAPWSETPAPSRVQILDVTPGDTQIARGEALTVSASVLGVRDDETIRLRYSTDDEQTVDQSVAMPRQEQGARVEARLPRSLADGGSAGVMQDLEYWIEAGDARTRKYKVTVFERPTLVVQRVRYEYPTYTGIPSAEADSTGDLRAIEGTRVTLYALANQPIRTAHVDFDSDGKSDLKMNADGDRATASFTLSLRPDRRTPTHTSYVLRLVTADGRTNVDPAQYRIEVTPDYAPEVRITKPEEPEATMRIDEILPIGVEARDPDFALARVSLVGKVAGRDVAMGDLLSANREGRFTGAKPFSPAEAGLQPGEVIEYWAEARDNRRPEANLSVSERRRLRITGPVDENTANNSNAPGAPGEQGQQPPDNDGQQNDEQQNQNGQGGDQGGQGDEKGGEQAGEAGGQDGGAGQQAGGQTNESEGEQAGDAQDQSAGGGRQDGQQPQDGQQQGGQQPQDGQQQGGQQQGGQQQGGQQQGGQQQGGQQQGGQQQGGQPQDGQPQGGQQQEGQQQGGQQQGGQQQGGDPQGGQPGGEQQQNLDGQNQPAGEQNGSAAGQGNEARRQEGVAPEGNDGEAFERISEHLAKQDESQKQQPGSASPGGEGQPQGDPGASGQQQQPGGESAEASGEPGAANHEQQPAGDQPAGAEGAAGQRDGQQAGGDPPQGQNKTGESGKAGQPGAQPDDGHQAAGAQNDKGDGQQNGQNPQGQQPGGGRQQPGAAESPELQHQRPGGGSNEADPTKPSPAGGRNNNQGDAGSGHSSDDKQGSPIAEGEQGAKQARDKTPDDTRKADGDKEPSSAASDKRETDSKGATGGDATGGGQEGGGQRADASGQGNAGEHESSDQGGAPSKEQGPGEAGSSGGEEQAADGKTGTSSETQPGAGSKSRESSDGTSAGGEQAGGETPGEDSSAGEGASRDGEQAGDQTGADGEKPGESPEGKQQGRGASGGQKSSGSGAKSKSDAKSSGEKTADSKAGSDEQSPSDSKGGATSSLAQPQGGGARDHDPTIHPDQPSAPEQADEANLEYARQQTNLVLERLEEQLARKRVDKELLDNLGWTPEQLERFVSRWKDLKTRAAAEGDEAGQARRELDAALRSLGLRRSGPQRITADREADKIRDLNEAYRGRAPLEYAEQVRSYAKGVSAD